MPTNVFDAGVRQRERRLQARGANLAAGNGPGFDGILTDESWDPFWGALHDRKDEAEAQGNNFRLNTAGIGGHGESMPQFSLAGADPFFVGRNRESSEYNTDSAAKFRLSQSAVRKLQAEAMADEDAARNAATDRTSMQYALQDPKASREEILARIPGHMRQSAEKFYTDLDARRQETAGAEARTTALGESTRLAAAAQRESERHNRATEHGRPVTSGDAGRIADLDTSLDDLVTLRTTLGTTGAGSKVGTMVPNAISEFTGWGNDSKARQATIDRVKQVIGRALEGGVLRKEDEIKYGKILPTIGDPPGVAKAKLDGLEKALIQRRETQLDALRDANYDVTRFNRAPAAAAPAPAGKIGVQAPNGKTYYFDSPAQADGFKKRAGIQ